MRMYMLLLGVVLAASTATAGVLNPSSSTSTPMISVMRPMSVSVTPERPEPFEEVFATVSGKSSDPGLTLGDATVSRQGSNVIVELQWRNSLLYGAVFTTQCCSAGYGIEQVRPTVSGMLAMEPYEATVSLGSFDVGRYRIHVYSEGAVEGEAQAVFDVEARQVLPTLFDFGPFAWPIPVDGGFAANPILPHVFAELWQDPPAPAYAGDPGAIVVPVSGD